MAGAACGPVGRRSACNAALTPARPTFRALRPSRARGLPLLVPRAVPRAVGGALAAELIHSHISKQLIDTAAGSYVGFCALSIALAALLYNLFGNISAFFALKRSLEAADTPEQRTLLHGVDVSASRYLQMPEVRAAVDFAAAAHAGQRRRTGEPYVAHCIETALIVEANLPRGGADVARCAPLIQAAILHDVLDDTPTPLEALVEAFGPRTAALVDTVAQLSQARCPFDAACCRQLAVRPV